jgi:hypothetical protein
MNCASQVLAKGKISNTKVTGIYCGIFDGENMCSVYFKDNATGSPSCVGASYKLRMQLNAETDIGKSMLSLALIANTANKSVYVSGTGACSIWPDTEDLNSIFIVPRCVDTNTAGCIN